MNSKKNMELMAVGWLKVNGYGWIGKGTFKETLAHHAKRMELPQKELGDVFRMVLPVLIWGRVSSYEDLDRAYKALQAIVESMKGGEDVVRELISDILIRWFKLVEVLKAQQP
jgi:hypothetical protein